MNWEFSVSKFRYMISKILLNSKTVRNREFSRENPRKPLRKRTLYNKNDDFGRRRRFPPRINKAPCGARPSRRIVGNESIHTFKQRVTCQAEDFRTDRVPPPRCVRLCMCVRLTFSPIFSPLLSLLTIRILKKKSWKSWITWQLKMTFQLVGNFKIHFFYRKQVLTVLFLFFLVETLHLVVCLRFIR